MSVIRRLRKLAEKAEREFEEFLKEAKRHEVTIILFGSRARGNHTLISDYDLLIIHVGDELKRKGLTLNVFNVELEELRNTISSSPLLLAAILEGRVLIDNLNVEDELKELRKRLIGLKAGVSKDRIVLPKVYS